ncbi:OmpP1/FadL family transporter [Flavobacterium gyeonganense]|uniref:OmpP1/FadL family transporter n=1 Tax=Flavobacterium gyeonganense TaxID=1310418 RepID=A0ABV5HGA3_9FLAO|nr:transporter [Flavobacterium gyeonganense]
MKKIFILLITGLTASVSYSQEISDGVRYSQDNLTGTARFRAMGGAFGALGGDLSSLSVNPAGSAIFNNNQAGLTFSNQNIKNNSNYFNDEMSTKDNSSVLNQAGVVFVFNTMNPNNNWKKITIGANYENTNNFSNKTVSVGTNTNNSIDDYFLAYANGIELRNTNLDYRDQSYSEQQAYFGLRGKVIIPASNTANNTQYLTNVPAGSDPTKGKYYQENEVHTVGYNSKLSINIATSYNDRLYLGANLNVHVTDHRSTRTFYEDNANPLQARETISNLRFNNEIYTYGNGFSFQLGAIGKITDSFRLGVAYESNTWYELYDEITQSLFTTTENSANEVFDYAVNPNITNVYKPYTLQTPGKFTFSGAYIFGKTGLISLDYSIKDYGNTKFKPTSDSGFRELNNDISNQLTTSGELRIGGEYKIKRLSLRGGYRFEGSPYKDGKTIGDLNSYSGGLGYNFGGTKIDLAYSYTERESNQGFFATGLTNPAKINSKLNNVSVTLLFEL